MKSLMRILGAGVLALGLTVGTASAAVLHDEGTDGDLDGVAGTALGNLGLGLNQVLGSLGATPPSDTDRFNFVLPVGLQIDSISVNWSFANGEQANTSLNYTPLNLFDDNFGPVVTSSISAAFFDSTGPETGPIPTNVAGSTWDITLTGSLIFSAKSYTVDITTSSFTAPGSVPLPAAFPLLMGGLGFMGFMGWRRKRGSADA